MKKFFVLIVALASLALPNGARAQAVALPMGASAAVSGGAYAGKKAVGACIRHPFLCAATVAVGTAYVGKVARETRKLDAQTPLCDGNYVPLYRAVGKIERLEIAAIQRNVILPTADRGEAVHAQV